MTIPPSYWGVGLWKAIYAIAFEHPDNPSPEQKQATLDFFNSLKVLLPCEECKKHYTELLESDPVEQHLETNEALKKWVNSIQTKTAQKSGKPPVTLATVSAEINAHNNPRGVPVVRQQKAPTRIGANTSFSINRKIKGVQRKKKGGCGCKKWLNWLNWLLAKSYGYNTNDVLSILWYCRSSVRTKYVVHYNQRSRRFHRRHSRRVINVVYTTLIPVVTNN